MAALIARLQLRVVIPHIKDYSLDAHFVVALGSADYTLASLSVSPSDPVLDSSHLVYKEDFDLLAAKTDAFMEKSTKN